jgi:hypothetical protein
MRHATLAVLFLAASASAGFAQGNPQTREGFWISFGFGYSSLGCENCNDRVSGTGGYLRMGGTLSQRLLLGGEANGWSKSQGNTTLTVGNVGPVLLFYPSATSGFYLKGGLGLSTAELDLGGFSGEETGAGITLGLGYDARVGRGFALTPYFDILSSSFDGGSVNMVAFGLGFTWP